jgi:hypothetical protein
MKVHKVRFGDLRPECKKELYKNRNDIPVCIKRQGNGIHTDFRPIKGHIQPSILSEGLTSPVSKEPPVIPTNPQTVPPKSQPIPTPEPKPKNPAESINPTNDILLATLGIAGGMYATRQLFADTAGGQIEMADTLFNAPVELTPITAEPATIGAIEEGALGFTTNAYPELAELNLFEGGSEVIPVAEETLGLTAGILEASIGLAMGVGGALGTLAEAVVTTEEVVEEAESNQYQKGKYKSGTKPLPPYIAPAPIDASSQETMTYLQQKDQALADYQSALINWNAEQNNIPA